MLISVLQLKNGYQWQEINFIIELNMPLIKTKSIRPYQHLLVINLQHHPLIFPIVLLKCHNFGDD